MIGKCKKYRMRNILSDIMNKLQKKKERKFGSISIDNDSCENIASTYAADDYKSVREDNVLLHKVQLNNNSVVEAKLNRGKSSSQLKLVRHPKLEYFRLHVFIIFLAIDWDPIHIIDSGAEVQLVCLE